MRSAVRKMLWQALITLIALAMSLGVIYLFEQRSFRLWLINAGYMTLYFSVAGTILGAWH